MGQSGLHAEQQWGTMSSVACAVGVGIKIHGARPRACKEAFPTWDSGDIPPAADVHVGEGFNITVKRKSWRVGKVLGDAQRTRTAVMVAFACEPLDWAWLRVQHLDEQGQSLLHVADSALPMLLLRRGTTATCSHSHCTAHRCQPCTTITPTEPPLMRGASFVLRCAQWSSASCHSLSGASFGDIRLSRSVW